MKEGELLGLKWEDVDLESGVLRLRHGLHSERQDGFGRPQGPHKPPERQAPTNPSIKTFYERLRAKRKPKKVALIACIRKLLIILGAILRNRTPWQPQEAV